MLRPETAPKHDAALVSGVGTRSLDPAIPMRVVQSVRHRWLAKTETWLYNQVRFLPSDIESHVVARVIENEDQFHVPHIHTPGNDSSPRLALDSIQEALRVRRYPGFVQRRCREIAPGLIHAHFGPWGWAVRPVARRLKVPLVVTFYGFDVHQLPLQVPRYRARYRDLFRDAAAVLCEGPFMRAAIVDLGCPEEKAHVHRLGVDLEGILFRPRGVPQGRLRVLLASAFREKKGLPIAFEALGRIAHEVELEITLIGDASAIEQSVREKERIESAIQRAGLENRVRRLGFQPHHQMMKEAARADLFIAPSLTASDGDTEGGAPVTLIEMAALGVPVVSTRHCDIPGVVLDGKTGFLGEEGDPTSLEHAIRRALETGANCEPMTVAGRAHVEQNFAARLQGVALAKRYRALVDPHSSI